MKVFKDRDRILLNAAEEAQGESEKEIIEQLQAKFEKSKLE